MMYEYLQFADRTLVSHSRIIEKEGQKTVQVHFERPKEGGFDAARCELPSYRWLMRDGFSDTEMAFFREFLQHNAHLIFRYAETGGIFKCCTLPQTQYYCFIPLYLAKAAPSNHTRSGFSYFFSKNSLSRAIVSSIARLINAVADSPHSAA